MNNINIEKYFNNINKINVIEDENNSFIINQEKMLND